jgi:acetylornithine deacetylase/succinyl-diaminopimelate desuccinylase family protein
MINNEVSNEYHLSKEIVTKLITAVEAEMPQLIEVLQGAIRINSINPDHEEGKLPDASDGETKVSRFLAPYMEQGGMETDVFAAKNGRHNVVGVQKGCGGGRSLLFNGHVDVVGIGDPKRWKISTPFSGEIIGNKIYGRGSTDMKGGIVCAIAAVNAVAKAGLSLQGDILIEAVCGEENMDTEAGTGACLARGYRADAGIVVEPSAPPYPLAILPASPGALTFEIWIKGKAAHTCMRDEICRAGGLGDAFGASALDKAIFIYEGLRRLEQQWGFSKKHPVFTRPGHFTLHPGSFYAGPSPFSITEEACLTYTAWFAPQENAEDIKSELVDFVTKWCATDTWLKNNPPEFKWLISWPPYNVPQESPICRVLESAFHQALERTAPIYGFAAVSDASFLNAAGIPTVIMGPGNLVVAHGPDEYVEIEELLDATKVYALTMAAWCGVE